MQELNPARCKALYELSSKLGLSPSKTPITIPYTIPILPHLRSLDSSSYGPVEGNESTLEILSIHPGIAIDNSVRFGVRAYPAQHLNSQEPNPKT